MNVGAARTTQEARVLYAQCLKRIQAGEKIGAVVKELDISRSAFGYYCKNLNNPNHKPRAFKNYAPVSSYTQIPVKTEDPLPTSKMSPEDLGKFLASFLRAL